jgi:BASS family bile acid:Na+ symporter
MWINTVFLPLCLALMMLVVGSGLDVKNFSPLLRKPLLTLAGLLMQLILLPILAWLLIGLLQLAGPLAIALVLIAAAPGGATSNLFSYLARGDVPLSIALTACTSLLAPFWMPWVVQLQLGWLGQGGELQLSWWNSARQLLLVTAVPLLLGMLWRHVCRNWVVGHAAGLKGFASLVLLLMIVTLMWVNRQSLLDSLSWQTVSLVTGMACLALLAGYGLARMLLLDVQTARTLCFETGVQNAGVAMLMAFSQLQLPQAGMIALQYGLLMNIPALAVLWWFSRSRPALTGAQPG